MLFARYTTYWKNRDARAARFAALRKARTKQLPRADDYTTTAAGQGVNRQRVPVGDFPAKSTESTMPQRTRMFRVWTCLALAMTTGAMLLSWLERGAPVAAIPRTSAELQAAAASAVGDHREGLARWSGIVLVGVAGPAGPGGLTATRPLDDVHFVLSAQGHVLPQASWHEQHTLDANGGIRIGLASVSTDRADGQIRALRHLIDVLNQAVAKECGSDLPSAAPLRIAVEAGSRDRALMEAVVRQLREIWAVDRA